MAALTAYDVNLKSSGYGDLQRVLGTTETSPANIILHANINKWSKRKPVRYPSYQRLSEAQFAGNNDDHSDGYYYGVNCLAGAANWAGLHEVSFDYRRPQGGDNSPARLSDFIGYDHDAVPTMNGSFPTSAYRDLANNFRVGISIDTTGMNTTGIDIADIVQEATGRQLSTCYPFILLGNRVCVLKNANRGDGLGNYEITQIFYNNAWQQGFLADLTTYSGLGLGTVKCTVFLASYGGVGSVLPIDGTWHQLGSGQGEIFTSRAFPMPNATGINVTISDYYKAAVKAKVGVAAMRIGILATISWPEGNPTAVTTVKTTLRLGSGTVSQHIKETTYTPGQLMQMPSWTWSELGMLYYEGMQITLSVSVQTAIQGSSKWTQGEGFSGTITAQ